MRKLTLSIFAATLATGGVALAAPGMMQGDMTRAQVQAMAAEHFARMDANGDGVLNQADRQARRAQMFDRIDADNNGAISRDEFAAMHRGHRDGAEDGDRRGKRGHRKGIRGHRGGGMHMLRMADANDDGAVSQAEFTAGAMKMFDAADADNNGTVTDAERKAAHAKLRAEWKAKREARQAN
jgi:hypothetical protein